jgi:hypothetical protein
MKITEKAKVRQITSQNSDGNYEVTIQPECELPRSMNPMGQNNKYVEVTACSRVTFQFQIDLETRPWGIKGAMINVIPNDITMDLVVTNFYQDSDEEEFSKTLHFDPSKIPVELEPGEIITLNQIDLALNDDFSVDYKASRIKGYSLVSMAHL